MNYLEHQLPSSSYEKELTSLNESLKKQLEQCYIYIQRLEGDLRNGEIRHSESILNLDSTSVLDNNSHADHMLQIEKVTAKYHQKKYQLKKFEKVYVEMEQALGQAQAEREELRGVMGQMENGFNRAAEEMNGRMRELEGVIGEQRHAIEFYMKELDLKGSASQEFLRRIQESEKEKVSGSQETERLRQEISHLNQEIQKKMREIERQKQSNSTFQSTIQQLTIQYSETVERSNRQLRELENQHLKVLGDLKMAEAEREISKRTHTDVDNSLSSRLSIFSSNSPRYYPVNRRNTVDEQFKVKEENDRQSLLASIHDLQQQVKSLQNELREERSQTLKLKEDFVNMRIEYSNLISKNTQLIETNLKLEKQKNELNHKLQDKNNPAQFNSPSNNKNKSRVLNHTNNSIMKTVTSNTTTLSQHPTIRINAPKDGEVPVRDKNTIRSSHVCLSSSGSFGTSQHIQLRKSSAIVRTFPLYSSFK